MVDSKIRLLIIEPHTAVRLALAKRLQSSPEIEIVSAISDWGEARKMIALQKPDVVLVGLPRVNGAVPRNIIQDVAGLAETTAVIVLSSYADESARVYLFQAGARRYLLKDINTPQLIREIEAIADGKQLVNG